MSFPANISGTSRFSLAYLRERLARPTDALPLDLFRVAVGVLIFIYFLRTFLEAPDFSGPEGLIDHELSKKLFWFTQIGFFNERMPLWMFQTIFLFGCLCSVPLILGYRVKLFAAILYLIAVCTYRWNFLVMYVDDSIMHLVLFWLLLIPVGRTLILRDWLIDRTTAWQSWRAQKVPGTTVRCFLWNLALIYLVAGLWKWSSPMWREGNALYVILKLPISLSPDYWGPEHLAWLKFLNYGALVLEPLFPLVFILPKGHRVKYLLLLALLAFHLGTLVTLQIPFANVACMAAMVIPFGGELMSWLRRASAELHPLIMQPRIGSSGLFALVFVVCLTLAMISSITLPRWRMPTRRANEVGARYDLNNQSSTGELRTSGYEGLRPLQVTLFSSLWIVGVAQQYQLFNWIDERNFYPHYRVVAENEGGLSSEINPDELFLSSTRGVLIQFYVQGVTWMRVPTQYEEELKKSLHTKAASRFCRRVQPRGTISVFSSMERIVPGRAWKPEAGELFMKFRCTGYKAQMEFMGLDS